MYEIHELANIVAMAGEREQLALVEDIGSNGQIEPAVLWQGKIVDGRCRQLACMSLDLPLMTRELDSKLPESEVAKVVKGLNTRRNLTPTQKVISGVMEQERTGDTNAECARKWATSEKTFKNGKYIAKYRPELIPDLFDGKTVSLYDSDKGYNVTTNKINTVARLVKKQLETGVVRDTSEEVTIEWTSDGVLKTEAAKEWYYTTIHAAKKSEALLGALLVELANLKFKETKEV